MLAASGLDRSVETVFYVALAVLVVLIGSGVFLSILMFALMRFLIHIRVRARHGRTSIAFRAIESYAWAKLIVDASIVILLIGLGVASLQYEPLRSLWTTPPSPISLGIFVLTSVAVVVSMHFQYAWYRKLFAIPPEFIEHRLPDGGIQRTYPITPPIVRDWYSQPKK